jgi:hypothetical protein
MHHRWLGSNLEKTDLRGIKGITNLKFQDTFFALRFLGKKPNRPEEATPY